MNKTTNTTIRCFRTTAILCGIVFSVALLNTCDLFKPGFGDKVDINPPTVTVTSPAQNTYVKGTLTVKGTVADDFSKPTVTVRYTGVTGATIKTDVTVTKDTWSINIPTGGTAKENLPEGMQKVTVVATDGSGKTAEAALLSYIDNTPPTVLITMPQSYGASRSTTSDYIDIKGEVWDRSPITNVKVRMINWNGALKETKTADGTNTWSVRFITTGYDDNKTYTYAIDATDKAGNVNTYYYHSSDIWNIIAGLPPGTLFPATDEIGTIDQNKGGSTAGGVQYSVLFPMRHGASALALGDFNKINDATLPSISFSNLDPAFPANNVLGSKVPIYGYINPGPAGNTVTAGSIKVWIIPPATPDPLYTDTPNVDPADVSATSISSSVSFQIEPKVSGSYITSGHYKVVVYAGATGTTSTNHNTCSFMVDSGAPSIDPVNPVDLSLVTRQTFSGAPLNGQTGIEIRARVQDDNLVASVTATASLTNGGAALPGTATAAAIGPDDSTPESDWYKVRVPLAPGNNDIWFDLEGTDDSGTIARRTLHYTIDEDDPILTIGSPTAGAWLTGNSTTISGTSSDGANSVQYIYVWLGATAATPPADITTWNRVDGNASWVTTLALGSEGGYRIHAVAVDFAGNQSAEMTRDFSLDQGNPTLDETSLVSATSYKNSNFTLSGTAADTNALANIHMTEAKNGGAAAAVLNLSPSGVSQVYTYNKTVNAVTHADDGTYEYVITTTDAAGKPAASITRTVIVDTEAPALVLEGFTSGYNSTLNQVNDGVVYKFSADGGIVGVEKSGANYVAHSTIVTDGTPVDTSATGIAAWPNFTSASSVFSLSSDSTTWGAAGAYDLYVGVRDSIPGTPNVSWAKIDVNMDQNSDRPIIAATNLTESVTTALGQNPAILFTVQDDDSVDSSTIQYSLDLGSTWWNLNPLILTDGTLVQAKTTLTAQPQGPGTIRFRAMDVNAGGVWAGVYGNGSNYRWRESVDYPFSVDYGPPSITLTSPTAASVHNADISVSGSTQDFSGVANDKVEIQISSTSTAYTATYTSSTTPAVAVTQGATQSDPVTFSLSIPIATLADGDYNLQIRCTDGSNTTGTMDRPIAADITAPSNTFTQPAGGATVNGIITVKGEVSDNRQVSEVYLWHGASGLTPPALSDPSWNPLGGGSLWSFDADTISVTSGGYKVVVVTEDAAGNQSTPYTLNLTADQSTDRPVISLTNLTEGAPAADNPLGRNARILGNIQDDDGVGPTGVQIRIDENNDGDFSDGGVENWTAVSSPPPSIGTLISWSHDIATLSQGIHRVQVRSRDKNSSGDAVYGNSGNYTWDESTAVSFFIDFGPPVLAITGPANGVIETVDFNITGTAQDSYGIDVVHIIIDGGAEQNITALGGTVQNRTWSYPFIVSGQSGAHTYQIKAIDLSGAETTLDRQFVVDYTAPTSSVNTPQADEITNGTLAVAGTASDNYQLDDVYYWLGTQVATPPDYRGANLVWDGGTGDDLTGWTALSQTYSWSFDLNTVALGDGSYTLHVRGLDTGGNIQTAETTRNFTVDRASDKPVVSVSTLIEAGTYDDNLLPNTLQVAGMISDDDSVDGSTIQVAVDDDGNGTFDPPGAMNWTTVSPAVSDGRVVTWTHTFSGLGDGQYELFVRAADIYDVGGPYAQYSSGQVGPVRFSVDTAAPAGGVTYPSQGAYLNATSFDITGTATDASGIASVMIKVGAAAPAAVTNTGTNFSTWKYTYNYTVDGQVSYQIIVTDNFGKITTMDRYFTMDRTPPTVSFIQPGVGSTVNGSLLVRGEANDNYQVSKVYFAIAQSPPAFSGGYTLLPGTYNWQKRVKTTALSNGVWTIYVVTEDAAGNNNSASPQTLAVTINSSMNLPTVSLTTATGTLLDNTGTITGTVSDDDGVDAETIEINLGDGAGWVHVTSHGASGTNVSFSHSVAGLPERALVYSVQVRASDVGENFDGGDFTGPDDIPPVTNPSAAIDIKKDNGPPTASIANINNGLVSSGTLQGVYLKNQLTLTGTATDGVQVSLVEARLVGITNFGTPAVGTANQYANWTWTASGLTLSEPSVDLEVRVTDFHGRVTTYSYTLLVDKTAPQATIDTPASNPATTGPYNGSVVFRGSSSDGVKVEKVYYKFGTAAAAQPNGVYTTWTEAGSTYSWTTPALDTNALYNDAVDHSYHLSAVSVDSAGNEATVVDLSFTINQGTDRPALSMSEPTADQLFGSGARAFGSASDDDGLASIEIRIDANNDNDFADGGLENYTAVSSPASVAGTNVSWEHNLAAVISDGAYRLQVRARDSGYAAAPAPQKTFHEVEYPALEANAIAFDIDTAPPAITLTQIAVQDPYGGADRNITSSFSGSYINNDSTFTFDASDASGLTSVEVSPDGGTTWLPATHVSGNTYTRVLTINRVLHNYDGTRNIQYRATDTYSKVTTTLVTLIVDTYEPEASFTNPGSVTTNPPDVNAVNADAPNVNGDVIVQGTVSDSSAVTAVSIGIGLDLPAAAMVNGSHYRIVTVGDTVFTNFGAVSSNVGVEFTKSGGAGTGSGTVRLLLTNTGNNISWKITIAGSSNYANAAYAIDKTLNVWRLPVTVHATEFAGNKSQTVGYLDIDPNSDRPLVNVVSPQESDSVAGVFLINGTVSDDDGALSVLLQVDLNNDEHYGPWGAFDGTLDLNGDTDTTDPFEDETAAQTISVTNGAWTILMNTSGELNKSWLASHGLPTADGNIGFMATPVDIYGTTGAPQTVKDLYIDSEAPVIRGLDVDGTTEIAAPTPPTGTFQKGDITLRAVFKDDKQLDDTSMQYSIDGGASYQNIDAGCIEYMTGSTDPYVYRIQIPIVTAVIDFDPGAPVVLGNGVLQASLKVTDRTYKQTTYSVQYNVDNTMPEAAWNLTGTKPNLVAFLPYQGTPPNEIYSLHGDGSTINNEVFGMANDRGTISGIEKVNVYFVKGGDFINPSTGALIPTGAAVSVRQSSLDLNDDGDYVDAGEYTGTDHDIPFTETYVITVNMRTELGQYDANPPAGDNDGFNESLKSKGGYDEWFSYLNTTVLPDGPIDVYFVAYDQAGNKVYDLVDSGVAGKGEAQVANNPPEIDSFADHGQSPWTGTPVLKVMSGTLDLDIDATDTNTNPGIKDTGWLAAVSEEWVPTSVTLNYTTDVFTTVAAHGLAAGTQVFIIANTMPSGMTAWMPYYVVSTNLTATTFSVSSTPGGPIVNASTNGSGVKVLIRQTSFTSFFYNTSGTGGAVRAFTSVPAYGASSGTGRVSINTATDGFTEGHWFKVTGSIVDIDDNSASDYFYMRINNNDLTPPSVTIDPFTQSSIDLWTAGQGPYNADIAAGSINTGTDVITVSLPSWIGNGTKVAWAGGTAPVGTTPGTAYYIVNNTGTTCQLSASYGGAAVDITSVAGTYDLASGGHVEDALDSRYNGTDGDEDLSGTVKITGTVQEDTDVSSLHVEIDGVDQGTAVLSNQTGDPVLGYSYNWTFLWDTARQGVSAIAKDNVVVRVYGVDPANNFLAAGSRPTRTVDVAPYITSIVDSTGLSSDVLRGATGKYSISSHATNRISVRGYNLGTGSVAPAAWVSPTAANPTAGTAPGTTWISRNEVQVSKNLTRSGYLTVIVSTIPSVNNFTLNTRARNIESSLDPRSTQWTDDRYLWVWANTQLNGTAFTGKTFFYPDMVMTAGTGTDPLFAFCDNNTGDLFRQTGANAVQRRAGYREPMTANIGYASNAAASGGGYFIISNMNSDQSAGANVGFLDVTGWGDNVDYSYGATQRWSALEGIDYGARTFGRFMYPRMIVENANATFGVNCYVVYFDGYAGRQDLNFIGFYKNTNATTDNVTNPASQAAKSTSVTSVYGATLNYATQWYDFVKVGTTGIAIAYYDRNTQTLKLAWSYDAFTLNGNNQAVPNTGAHWAQLAGPIDSAVGAGWNISMAVSGTKIFVAYLDTSSDSDPDLKMARITWNGTITTPVVDGTVFIDKYGSVGSWSQIQMINDTNLTGVGTAQPFISFYADSQSNTKKPIRVAFPRFDATTDVDQDPGTAGTQYLLNGTTSNGGDETYSGNWEIITVPALSIPKGGIQQFNHVSIKKYTNGIDLPILGWLGDYLEYAKLQPNN